MASRQKRRVGTMLRWDRLLVSVTALLLVLTLAAVGAHGQCTTGSATGIHTLWVDSTDKTHGNYDDSKFHTRVQNCTDKQGNLVCSGCEIRRSFITATIPSYATSVTIHLTGVADPGSVVGVYAVGSWSSGTNWNNQPTWGIKLGELSGSGSVTFAVTPGSTVLYVGLRMTNECTATKQHIDWSSAQITASWTISASITSQTNVSCFGGNTGSVTVAGAGGTSPYQYQLGAGSYQGSGTFNSLFAGSYTVTVKDANGCTTTQAVTITQPTALSLSETHDNVSHFGGSDGWIDLSISGGTTPYSYSWSPGGAMTQDLNNLAAGTYKVTVTDKNGCTATKTVTITQPAAAPEIAIVKTVSAVDTAGNGVIDNAGDIISYQIVITNTGNMTLNGVSLSDPLLEGVHGTLTPPVAADDGILGVGESWTYSGAYTVQQGDLDGNGGGDGTIDNTATVSSTELVDKSDNASVAISQGPAIALMKSGSLDMTVVAPSTRADVGDKINYTFTVTNTGNVSLSGVTLTDNSTDAPPIYVSGDTNSNIELDLTETWTYSASHTVTQAELDAGSPIVNVATVDSSESTPATDDETVTLPVGSAVTVRKDVVPNDASQWTITLTLPNNQGEHAFHPVLGDGGVYTFTKLESGIYTVTESGPDGYLSSVTCATCAGSGRSASFTVDDQTGVEVLFTNTRQQSGGGSSGGGSSGGTTAFSAPVPTVGPDQNVCVGEKVCLSATAFDPEHGSEGLRYQWSFFVRYYNYGIPVFEFPAGSRVLDTIEGFNTATPCFIPDMAGDYVLVVTVTDQDGMWSMDAVKIHAEPCGEVFSCSYDEGWNLLSLLGQPLNPNAEDILAGTSAQGPALAYESGGYVEADTLSPIEGFWVHFFTPDSLEVVGREIRNDVTITLEQPGWHLISSPFAIDWERVLVFVNGAERFVVESVARDLIADFCACYDPEASVYRVSEEVLPCQGYWVRTYQPNVVLKLRWGALNFAAQPNLSGCEGETTDNVPAPPSTQTAGNGRASVLAYPNPVRHSVVHFEIAGERVAAGIQVSVFALSGELVWQGESSENAMDWEPRAPSGERLPWGPYMYCVSRSQGEDWLRVGCGILFIAEVDG